jgi:hypothetical protein
VANTNKIRVASATALPSGNRRSIKVRDVNAAYLEPLQSVFPSHRKGPLGDSPKANCTTCHTGVYKPLFGVSMLKDYPELARSAAAVPVTAPLPRHNDASRRSGERLRPTAGSLEVCRSVEDAQLAARAVKPG